MTLPVIYVNQLTRMFGSFVAVDHISFEVNPGEIVGYLGPNGSGKTTTIRMLLGLLKPTSGNASVLGFDVDKQSEDVRARAGYMSQKFAIYDDLTVFENLQFYGGVYGITDRARIARVIHLAGLDGHEDSLTRAMSAGWRQRLALAIAMVHSPGLLFLDEPTSGVDPNARRDFWDLIYNLASEGVTVLVTTHYMDEAEYCHRVGMMRAGKLLAMDTPSALKEQYIHGRIWEIYTDHLLDGLELLAKQDQVQSATLAGDHVRMISSPGLDGASLEGILSAAGIRLQSLRSGEPTLEDVFSTLAR